MDYKLNGQAFTLIEQTLTSWSETLNWHFSGIGRWNGRFSNAGAEHLKAAKWLMVLAVLMVT